MHRGVDRGGICLPVDDRDLPSAAAAAAKSPTASAQFGLREFTWAGSAGAFAGFDTGNRLRPIEHAFGSITAALAHGTAIVGLPLSSGAVRVFYEGNVIGAVNLQRYQAKAHQAAGRMLHEFPAGYPTRAREDVEGDCEPRQGRLDNPTARPRR